MHLFLGGGLFADVGGEYHVQPISSFQPSNAMHMHIFVLFSLAGRASSSIRDKVSILFFWIEAHRPMIRHNSVSSVADQGSAVRPCIVT